MERTFSLLCVLLCVISCSSDQGVKPGMREAAGSQSLTLQPWLVGLTALVGFLLIVFVVLIAFRFLRKKSGSENQEWGYEKSMEMNGGQFRQTSM